MRFVRCPQRGIEVLALLLLLSPHGVQAQSHPATADMAAVGSGTGGGTRFHGPFDTLSLVAFDVHPKRLVADVRYVIRNDGQATLIVFDRGTVHDVSIGRQVLGGVGVPAQEPTSEGVTLVHAAQPLPEPSPTSPPTPLGVELAPGASLVARFRATLPGPSLPKRLRWCVGVMPFADDLSSSPLQTEHGVVWTASFASVGQQQRLCTPWYDIAGARFDKIGSGLAFQKHRGNRALADKLSYQSRRSPGRREARHG